MNEPSSGCRGILATITEAFGFLFDEYGFIPVEEREAWTSGRCLVVLQSPDCRLRFIYELGSLGVDFGAVTAPATWSDLTGAGARVWYPLRAVANFLQGRPRLSLMEAYRESKERAQELDAMSQQERISRLSDELRSICKEACALFRGDSPPERLRFFEEYLASPPPR